MKIFLDYINNQQVISDEFLVREAADGIIFVQSKLVDDKNDILSRFNYEKVTIDPTEWKETKKKALPDNTVAGAAKRIIQAYLKKLNNYYTNQIITLLHGASYHYPETATADMKDDIDEKAIVKLTGFKKEQYARLLDRQALMRSRAASMHTFLGKLIQDGLKTEGLVEFYVCQKGTLGTTMLIPAVRQAIGEEPCFYFIMDGLNVQEI